MIWPPTRGDQLNQLERFTLTGLTATYTFRGMLFVSIAATTVKLYRDIDRGGSDEVASGTHAAPTDWTKVTLAAVNASGITGSCYIKYSAVDAAIEVWPAFNTDTELQALNINIADWPATEGTSFATQHQKAAEDFVRLMRQKIPPTPQRILGRSATLGTSRGDLSSIWRVNSVGDYEMVRLQNLDDYREWALHHVNALIYASPNRILPEEEQAALRDQEKQAAAEAFAEVIPLVDWDADLDADEELPRFRISRG
jgi:hypothetical protein